MNLALNRRTVLLAAAAGASAVLLPACGGSDDEPQGNIVEVAQNVDSPARTSVASQTTGSHIRSREPPRSQAMTAAPAVAGMATAAGSATHISRSCTPNTVHATPLIVEFASAAMLTPAALVI